MMDFIRILITAFDINPDMAVTLLKNMGKFIDLGTTSQMGLIHFLGGFPKDIQMNKIASIKYIREKTGLGLKEAKDLYEQLIPRHQPQY